MAKLGPISPKWVQMHKKYLDMVWILVISIGHDNTWDLSWVSFKPYSVLVNVSCRAQFWSDVCQSVWAEVANFGPMSGQIDFYAWKKIGYYAEFLKNPQFFHLWVIEYNYMGQFAWQN